jgi:hypothetical protein
LAKAESFASAGSASSDQPPPASTSWSWLERLPAAGAAFYEWLSRPRVRLTVTGVILLLIGALITPSSVWTLPLVVVGALMVVVAWIGRRLDGRFAVQWGETGTQLEFRARIMAPPEHPVLPRAAPGSETATHTRELEPEHPQAIEGEAHTVEIEVAELEALIAAAETRDTGTDAADTGNAEPDASAHAGPSLRVSFGDARRSEAGR